MSEAEHNVRRRLRPRFGIGTRLTLGLAAVAAVVVVAHVLATRTTRAAVEAVHSMRTRHEPLTHRASLILEQLSAYDGVVGDDLESDSPGNLQTLTTAGNALQQAVERYFDGTPRPSLTPVTRSLRAQLLAHIQDGRQLALDSTERAQWREQRWEALNRVYQLVATAGGTGLTIHGEVITRPSLSALATAIDAVRYSYGPPSVIARRERIFETTLRAHATELSRSPGEAWMGVVQSDFQRAVRLRRDLERLDTRDLAARRALLQQSGVLMKEVQDELQAPSHQGLLDAARYAAISAEAAEHTVTASGVTVLVVMGIVSALLIISISLPVRRLTAATRLLASGDRTVRAPRGGSAEIDELAGSFNTMADRISQAEADLRAQQAELERHVAERTQQLHHLAHHDPLTQLPNRRQLAGRLAGALARARQTGRRVALLFVDMDNFKSLNDTLGHNYGDKVLQGIAQRLQAAAGPNSLVARLGGDEFTLLIEELRTVEEVEQRAGALVATLQQPLTIEGRSLATTASVGASLFPDHADDPEGLLRAADVALFRAKELGRNRYALYRAALYDAAAQRFRLEQALRQAVEAGELLLMFQPEVALGSCEVTALEALLRWRKPGGRIATATEFIHIAEKSGLIHELTGWVLRSATSTVAAWRASGWSDARVAINVSPPQFFESDFVRQIADALESAGLPASALELELTETVLQTGSATIEALRRLRELGISIALDDFGIGYSSLTSLEQLPINRVKLDRMLVEGVDSNPRSAAIVRSIVTLCHGLGLQVVAEGVERPTQLQFLAHCGGPMAVQGYLLAKPVEAAAAAEEAQAATARARAHLAAVPAPPLTLVSRKRAKPV
ncbi:MAG TPA: EAL domain-containing protein [Steroidobacteraceae bacterium]|nr:EAL domain-containing protein [Steroidobacteraceae bacterium]